jgi:hypothetical protein
MRRPATRREQPMSRARIKGSFLGERAQVEEER